MAISFNTGTTTFVTNTGTPGGHTFTIPAGVLTGDIIYVLVMVFTTATGALTLTLTSGATAPTAAATQQNTGTNSGIQVSSQVFQIVAGASDAGATLTFGATGGTGGAYWYNVGLGAWTGASATNPDVNAGNQSFSASGTGAVTTPSATTGVSGDWQIQFIGEAPPGSPVLHAPAGLTVRESILAAANAGLLLEIADSNGSVGGSGTSIGNGAWTVTNAGSGNTWLTAFTLGLAPAGATAVSGTVQSLAAVPVARRRPGRAVVQFTPVATVNTGHGPAGTAQPLAASLVALRRKPGRAVIRFTPVTTTNAPAKPHPQHGTPSSDEARGFKRWLLWGP